jgi:pimeloyl-ACP methyl ester carboxylesterase
MWTSVGVGRVTAGEKDVIMRPKSRPATAKPGVLYVHGAEGDVGGALTWMTIQGRSRLINSIADAGYTMLSCDLGGVSTWGNDTAISRITTARNYLLTLQDVAQGPIILVAQSMGGQNSMVWAASNKTMVKGIVLVLPVVNIQDVRDRVYTSSVDSAYSGGYSDATYGTAHSPYIIAANGGLNGIPIQLWYGQTDTTCLQQYSIAMESRANKVELHSVIGGHAESTMNEIDPAQILRFMAELP